MCWLEPSALLRTVLEEASVQTICPPAAAVTFRSLGVPSPSWPAALAPQARDAPPDWTARLWNAPAAMLVNGVLGATGVAIVRKPPVVPTPSWPWLLRPQAMPPLLVRM